MITKRALLLSSVALASCAQPDAGTVETATAAVTSVDSLRDEMQARFGVRPDTVELRRGARLRLVYLDTSGRDRSARSLVDAYTEDSLRFDGAFGQAVWLWTRVAERDGVDTITVRYHATEAHGEAPLSTTDYYFYPKQLENPAARPVLGREAVGPNRSDSLPSFKRAVKR